MHIEDGVQSIKEKGLRVVSNSRNRILSIDLVQKRL